MNIIHFFVIMFLISFFVSCNKEPLQPGGNSGERIPVYRQKASAEQVYASKGNDDELIIQLQVVDSNDMPVRGAHVELLFEHDSVVLADTLTNERGEAVFEVNTGTFYFILYKDPKLSVVTDSVFVNRDISLLTVY